MVIYIPSFSQNLTIGQSSAAVISYGFSQTTHLGEKNVAF